MSCQGLWAIYSTSSLSEVFWMPQCLDQPEDTVVEDTVNAVVHPKKNMAKQKVKLLTHKWKIG
jgi:hypothetical protein